jgi:hypothetical protein
MQLRETLMNLAITAVLVLIIVLVAILLRESRPQPPAAIPVKTAGTAEADTGVRPMKAEFEILKAEWVESRANEADTIRLRVGSDEHIFVLYYVDALEASWSHPQRINDQSRWFGEASSQAIVDTGTEAVNYVRTLLTSKPFFVQTRWERVPSTNRYYALVMVEHVAGEHVYLADLLMRAGYARIAGVTTTLPGDKRTVETYLSDLQALGKHAQKVRAGIWSKVK